MATPARLHRTLFHLALALLFAASPAALRAQDSASAPASTAPRVNLPAGTQVTRPPSTLSRPPSTIARPPAGTTTVPSQEPAQQLVTVPDLSGRTVDEARRLLGAAGLVLGSVAEGQGSGTPGTVIQQQPRAGSAVAAKSDVRLWLAPRAAAGEQPTVSRPPVTRPTVQVVTVPRLAGRTVDDARATLARVNLQVGAVAEEAGRGAPGTIVRQSPRPGMPVLPGSSVRVWIVPARVAQQPPRDTPDAPLVVRVPNVVGQTVEDARETLRAAGLTPGTLAEGSGSGVPGTVARQQPAAGSATVPNARVGLWLVPARTAALPPVATRPDPPAEAPRQPPPVQRPPLAQNPTASVPVVTVPVGGDSATESVVTVPVGGDSATVPDVRRLPLREAQASLAAAGYAAVVDAALVDSAGWTVSAQQPSPGARLATGGRVALLLNPPAPVAATTATQPPAAAPPRQTPAPPAVERRGLDGRTLWIVIAALLIVAAAAGAWRMRAARSVLPVAAVSARLRMDTPARVAVEGMPFGDARLRLRMNPGRTAARVAAAGPLFVQKEVSGD